MVARTTIAIPLLVAWILSGCADKDHQIVISVPEQRMALIKNGQPLAIYPVSTSKYGLGDCPGSSETPLGMLEIAHKIGGGVPAGAVFKSREPTGEIVAADAPGRDAIVSRILWLRGLDSRNQNAYDRYIYIHGAAEERNVGYPVSYGCIRMHSRDVIALYDEVGAGAKVVIRDQSLAIAAYPFLVPGAIIPPYIPALQPAQALKGTMPASPALSTRKTATRLHMATVQ